MNRRTQIKHLRKTFNSHTQKPSGSCWAGVTRFIKNNFTFTFKY